MKNKEKVWRVKGREETYTDPELTDMISKGELKAEDEVTCKELKDWIRIKESVYSFYLKEDKHETV